MNKDRRSRIESITERIEALAMELAEVRHLESRITEMRSLPEGWNGYGATAPSARAVALAKQILSLSFSNGILPTDVQPTGDASVLFTFRRKEMQLFVEVYSDEEIAVLCDDAKGKRAA